MLPEHLRHHLWPALKSIAEGNQCDLFAVLDGAAFRHAERKLPDVFEEEDDVEFSCLFRGETDPEVLVRAPYLVKVVEDSRLADWLCTDCWGINGMIFIVTPVGISFDEVLSHLREFIEVRLPDGRLVFFRFFDPRVLRVFLPSCDAHQNQQLFKDVRAFACESEDGSSLVIDTVGSSGPVRKKLSLLEFRPTVALPHAIL